MRIHVSLCVLCFLSIRLFCCLVLLVASFFFVEPMRESFYTLQPFIVKDAMRILCARGGGSGRDRRAGHGRVGTRRFRCFDLGHHIEFVVAAAAG